MQWLGDKFQIRIHQLIGAEIEAIVEGFKTVGARMFDLVKVLDYL